MLNKRLINRLTCRFLNLQFFFGKVYACLGVRELLLSLYGMMGYIIGRENGVIGMGDKPKTNAMRLLDAQKIDYELITYDKNDGKIDGVSVANKIGKAPSSVFKTLVARGASGSVYVFLIPVAAELDVKKAARAAGEKKIELVPVKDIQKLTGYIRGGCSPIGMKKQYPTYLDKSAELLDCIIVSAGKIGAQVEMPPASLCGITNGVFKELVRLADNP